MAFGMEIDMTDNTHADALAEITAIRAENAALQQGYNAAVDALKDMAAEFRALDLPYGSKAYAKAIAVIYSHPQVAAPVGEYPAITTEFINKHAHPSQAAKLCRADWSGKDESSVETVHPEVIKLLHAYVDADRAMRGIARQQWRARIETNATMTAPTPAARHRPPAMAGAD